MPPITKVLTDKMSSAVFLSLLSFLIILIPYITTTTVLFGRRRCMAAKGSPTHKMSSAVFLSLLFFLLILMHYITPTIVLLVRLARSTVRAAERFSPTMHRETKGNTEHSDHRLVLLQSSDRRCGMPIGFLRLYRIRILIHYAITPTIVLFGLTSQAGVAATQTQTLYTQ